MGIPESVLMELSKDHKAICKRIQDLANRLEKFNRTARQYRIGGFAGPHNTLDEVIIRNLISGLREYVAVLEIPIKDASQTNEGQKLLEL